MKISETLLLAAVSGLLATASVACDDKPATDPSSVSADAGGAAMSSMPSGDSMSADAGTAKHACKGQNGCKGQGGCKTDKNACKGQNACKGTGGCKTA